ncbi:hypothetical protein ACQPZA_22605 [Pseudonocardia xinjiangensis]|uniref:hypothetical protein n=1 Tax=Pseudonocardia xinjiangensis TaxID=75289 RepID=UPI003D8B816F
MRRFGQWLVDNADGMLALTIAITVGALGVLDVLGGEEINAAILLTLALLAATLLRDRKIATNNLNQSAAVRLVHGAEVDRMNSEAHRDAGQWIFKGGTGSSLRSVTLRACVEAAREANRPVRMQIEIIDPTDEQLCRRYAEYRASLRTGSDRDQPEPAPETTSRNAFATILAICWYRQRFVLLQPEIGLSKVMTTFRWDISPTFALMTQEDRNAPAMFFDRGMSHYRAYLRELTMSFEQSRRLNLSRIEEHRLSDEPTPEEVRTLFSLLRLDLPVSMTDNNVADIISRAKLPRARQGRFRR